MKITESTIQQDGSCNYCNSGNISPNNPNYFPYDKVFVVEGKNTKSVFCNSCLTELQMFRGGRKYKLILGFHGGKEVEIEVSGEPTRDEMVKAMEFHNADNYRIEYL